MRFRRIHSPLYRKTGLLQVQRSPIVRAGLEEESTGPAELVSEAQAILADLPADLGEAKVADLQRVCVALRVSKTGETGHLFFDLDDQALPDIFVRVLSATCLFVLTALSSSRLLTVLVLCVQGRSRCS